MKDKNRFSVMFALVLLLIGYFMSAFLKLSASITMPMFQKQLGMSSTMVGFVSSMLYVTYALMQVLGSVLCVKFGSLQVMTAGMFLSAGGTLCFSLASSPLMILAGRILIGLGIGPAFVSVITLLQENFEGREYTRWTGFCVMICNLGGACSSGPLNIVLQKYGISVFFGFVTVFQIVVCLLMIFSAKLYKGHVYTKESTGFLGEFTNVFGMIVKNRMLVGLMTIWIAYNSILAVYQGLWVVKWTNEAFPNFNVISSYSGTVMGIGIMAGCLLCDRIKLSNRGMKRELEIHVVLQLIIFTLCIAVKKLGISFLGADLFIDCIYGISVGMICILITSLVRENSDSAHNAVIMGILNGLANIVVLLAQSFSGVLIDFFSLKSSALDSFSFTFIVLDVLYLLLMYFGIMLLKKR